MNYIPIQLKLPVDLERIIKINDPVYSFSEVMAHIDLKKYFVEKEHETGRPRYDREKLLKIVLFAFMEFGYCSVRFIQKLCETDIRFLWMLDEENAPSHMTISNFIHKELSGSLDAVFNDINRYILGQLCVDLNHAYIDGTKIEANANKYTWVFPQVICAIKFNGGSHFWNPPFFMDCYFTASFNLFLIYVFAWSGSTSMTMEISLMSSFSASRRKFSSHRWHFRPAAAWEAL